MSSPILGPFYPARVGYQLHTKKWDVLALNKNWQLKIDPKSIGAREGWYASEWKFNLPVQVPGCIQALKELADNYPSSEGYPNSYLGTAWYKCCSIIPESWVEGKVWLKFGGIMPAAHIWMNGRYLGYHSYSPVAVKWDVSNIIKPGESNCVTVEIVENDLGFAGGMRGYKGWSGLYRPVEIEHTNKIWLDDDIYVKPDFTNSQAILKIGIHNDFPHVCSITVDAGVYSFVSGTPISNIQNNIKIPANEEMTVKLKISIPNFHPWSPEDPFLYFVKVRLFDGNREVDGLSERFGMRELRVNGNRLELNREPFMLRAWGEEYFSTNISPILDQSLLKHRIMAAKQMGFNGVRYHTHIAPPEELNLCDELGLFVHDEISVISNFNKTEPYPENKEVWRNHILESRNHPSLVIYCMGNEGSQILNDKLYPRVQEYYNIAKELAPDHLVLAASGSQGEHPKAANDFETPHLWSYHFKWAYEGLTCIPWAGIKHLLQTKVCVLHEYGKMTVWPDPAEEKLYKEALLKPNFGSRGRIALEKAGMIELLPKIVKNSRALSVLCNKIVIESARRQPGIDGYHLFTFFRMGYRNRGLVDDFGQKPDINPACFRQSNGPVVLLIDRDWRGRALTAGQPLDLGIHLSHFGSRDIKKGHLRWRLIRDGDSLKEGEVSNLSFVRGHNGPLCRVLVQVPNISSPSKVSFEAELHSASSEKVTNHWNFWIFPYNSLGKMNYDLIALYGSQDFENKWMMRISGLHRLKDLEMAYKGCLVGRKGCLRDFPTEFGLRLVISDTFNPDLLRFVEKGGNVLLLGPGQLPKEWFPKDPDGADVYSFFTPFRAGWDHGNAATIIKNHLSLGDFPHEGFCDLQFFELIQNNAPVVLSTLPIKGRPIIWSIPLYKIRPTDQGFGRIQGSWSTERRAYLMESCLGKGKLLICSMKLDRSVAGEYLLACLIKYLLSASLVKKPLLKIKN